MLELAAMPSASTAASRSPRPTPSNLSSFRYLFFLIAAAICAVYSSGLHWRSVASGQSLTPCGVVQRGEV